MQSNGEEAAVDRENGTVDHARVVRKQRGDRPCHIVHLGKSADGMTHHHWRGFFRIAPCGHGKFGECDRWSNRVDADAIGAELLGEYTRRAFKACLRSGIAKMFRKAAMACD